MREQEQAERDRKEAAEREETYSDARRGLGEYGRSLEVSRSFQREATLLRRQRARGPLAGKARAAYAAAIEASPAFGPARASLIDLEMRAGRYERIVALLKDATEPDLIVRRAEAYLAQGIRSSGHEANAEASEALLGSAEVAPLLLDPQTSGGLLMGVAAPRAQPLCESLHRAGYAHAAIVGIGGNAQPAALGDLGEGLAKAGAGAHDAVFQIGRVQVTIALHGGHDLIRDLAGLGQNGGDHITRRLGKFLGPGDLVEPDHLVEEKLEF